VILALILSLNCSALPERILFLLPISSKSHKNVFDPLINALAAKGREITTVSSVRSSGVPSYVHEIVPVPVEEVFKEYLSPFEARKLPRLKRLFAGSDHFVEICHKVYENVEVQNLLKTGRFDLVVVNGILNHCSFWNDSDFRSPCNSPTHSSASNFNTERLGTHLSPSFVPLSFLHFTDVMTFQQRVANTVVQWIIKFAEVFYYRPIYREIKDKYH